MNVVQTDKAAATGTDTAEAQAKRTQLARLAHEFEAMFLSEMLRGMRSSMLSEEEQQGLGSATMTDTFDSQLGLSLSQSGGFGLAKMMMDAMERQGLGGDAALARSAPAVSAYTAAASAPVAAPIASVLESTSVATPALTAVPSTLPLDLEAVQPGPVTSPFGWRSDPFTGRAQFHAGTDVRMAYGQDVQAVAPGRVASVSERQGYGLTVVIDHGNGLETRYAHLSGAAVREGDIVEAGQVVAQSGNSGRSTGPHLHLEARRNGQAVDVTTLLKNSGLLADSYADRSHVRSGQ